MPSTETARNVRAAIFMMRSRLSILLCLCVWSSAPVAAQAPTRVWCDPTDHWIQGHAAWHLLSAASLVMLFRFYEKCLRVTCLTSSDQRFLEDGDLRGVV